MYLITSDSHFFDASIVKHERRTKFDSVQEHDGFILKRWKKWLSRLKEDDTFYFLGDLCGRDMESETFDLLEDIMVTSPCNKVIIHGNHDKKKGNQCDLLFDEVYDYPIYISNRVVLSHYPCAVYDSQINVHGHTHGMKLCGNNHLCASIHVNNYNAVTENAINSALGKIDPWCTKFLYEPWAEDYQLTQPHLDAIAASNGKIDLSASRLSYFLQHSPNVSE
jgi:calcineurin-like phosphoesterase family protein